MVAGDAGGTFRLTIRVRDRLVVYDVPEPCGYKQALAHVAHAVHRHAADGRIERVELERRVPEIGGPSLPSVTQPIWTRLESWDADVIARILSQPRPAGQRARPLGASNPDLAGVSDPLQPRDAEQLFASPGRAEQRPRTGNGANGHGHKQPGGNGHGTKSAAAAALTPTDSKEPCSRPVAAAAGAKPGAALSGRVPSATTAAVAETLSAMESVAVGPRPLADVSVGHRRPSGKSRGRAGRSARHRTTHRWHLGLTVAVIGVAWVGLAAILAGGKILSLIGSHGRRASAVAEHLPFNQLRQPAASTRPAETAAGALPAEAVGVASPATEGTSRAAPAGVVPGFPQPPLGSDYEGGHGLPGIDPVLPFGLWALPEWLGPCDGTFAPE
jgi:hypothetical protein